MKQRGDFSEQAINHGQLSHVCDEEQGHPE